VPSSGGSYTKFKTCLYTADVNCHIPTSFTLGVWTPWWWHRRAETCRAEKDHTFKCVCNILIKLVLRVQMSMKQNARGWIISKSLLSIQTASQQRPELHQTYKVTNKNSACMTWPSKKHVLIYNESPVLWKHLIRQHYHCTALNLLQPRPHDKDDSTESTSTQRTGISLRINTN